MLNNISWTSYLTFISFLSLLYYGWLYLKFYRPYLPKVDISSFSSLQVQNDNSSSESAHAAYLPKVPGGSQAPSLYTDMLDEIDAFMEEAAGIKFDKVSFLEKLRLIAGKYGSVEDPADKILLIQMVQQKGRSLCSLDLNEGEVAVIWNGT